MWTIKYGRAHIWEKRFTTRREAMMAWIRSLEPDIPADATEEQVLRHWTSIRRNSNCMTVKVEATGIEPASPACKAGALPLSYAPGDCVGSGYCCKKAPCYLAASKYGPEHWREGGPGCPSLVWDEKAGRHWCGEILNEKDPRRQQDKMEGLYIGAGCSSTLFNQDRERILVRLRSSSSSSRTSSGSPPQPPSSSPSSTRGTSST